MESLVRPTQKKMPHHAPLCVMQPHFPLLRNFGIRPSNNACALFPMAFQTQLPNASYAGVVIVANPPFAALSAIVMFTRSLAQNFHLIGQPLMEISPVKIASLPLWLSLMSAPLAFATASSWNPLPRQVIVVGTLFPL